ncbi:MAG: hypothetical protein KC431_28665, partial [Myxococcales bacterium]|nr:hypothetical protein [Myxococcales bacterium]
LILAGADAPDPTDMAATRALDRSLTLRIQIEPGQGPGAKTVTLDVQHRRLGPGGRASLTWEADNGRFIAVTDGGGTP